MEKLCKTINYYLIKLKSKESVSKKSLRTIFEQFLNRIQDQK